MTASARGKAMRKHDLVAANAEPLSEIEVCDNGKLRAEMLGRHFSSRTEAPALPCPPARPAGDRPA
jgi:hypothetical protein